jgi:hypothetical protein
MVVHEYEAFNTKIACVLQFACVQENETINLFESFLHID